MAFLEKLSKFFRRAPAPAAQNGSSTEGPAPVSISGPAVSSKSAPAAPETETSVRELFLQELRSIPTQPTGVDVARDELMKELRRLSGPEKGDRAS